MNSNNMIYENDEAITNGRLITDGSEITQSKRTQLNQWLKWNWNQNPPMTILGFAFAEIVRFASQLFYARN